MAPSASTDRSREPLAPEGRTVHPRRYLTALAVALILTLGVSFAVGGWLWLGICAGLWLLATVAAMLWLSWRLGK